MRIGLRIMFVATILLMALALAGCGTPSIDRVDVTWEADPPPRWGLYPGYRQEIPCPKGATYRADVYFKGKSFTGATIASVGNRLVFKPTAGSRDIEAQIVDGTHLNIYATLHDENGKAHRQLALRIELLGDNISFEFPK
ncbi:MAG: hypothetical protein P4L39_00920 [Humidesulfovibrio sp.]|nr:hypothetical protein [Humidesulfovibrio sp.]